MGVQELVDAFRGDPDGPDEEEMLAQLVAGGFVIPSDTAVATGVLQINPLDSVSGAVRDHYFFGDGTFVYAPADGVSAHDGISTLVLIGGYRYHRLGAIAVKAVEAVGIDAEPTPSAYGQAWIDLTGVVGDSNQIIVHTSRGWAAQDADYGPPIYVKTGTDGYLAKSFVHWAGDDGWLQGVGAGSYAAATIPLTALIGFGLGPVRVSDQTTFAPPGSRISGGTPTMPLGGTAANINDNSSATTGTTSALGDKTGASLADRIAARISYASAQDIIAADLLDVRLSTGTATLQLYTSIDNGSNWLTYGSSFACTSTAQMLRRAVEVAGVTDIALVLESKNYSTATLSLKWFNGHDDTFTLAKGNRFIVAANAFGILAGREGQVCSADEADVASFYAPVGGSRVFDISLGTDVQWRAASSTWESAAGVWIGSSPVKFTAASGGGDTGSSGYTYSASTPPTTSSRRLFDGEPITYRARKAGTKTLRLTYAADFQTSVGVSSTSWGLCFGIFRDSETNAIAWGRLPDYNSNTQNVAARTTIICTVDVPDTNEHTYTMALIGSESSGTAANGTLVASVARREFYCEERG